MTISAFSSIRAFRCLRSQQRRIADILSAYDDLIENNRRRMELLEEAARQLYREWFVRLRFPGHEHTRIINGVPEGWERRRFEELRTSFNVDSILPIQAREDGDVPVYGLDVRDKWFSSTSC